MPLVRIHAKNVLLIENVVCNIIVALSGYLYLTIYTLHWISHDEIEEWLRSK